MKGYCQRRNCRRLVWLDFLQSLQSYDDLLFVKINQQWTTPFLNDFFSLITNFHHTDLFIYFVAPIILFVWWFKFRTQMFAALLALAIMILVADTICYRGIKSVTHKERPFLNSSLNAQVRVGYKPKSSSFPSNHAVNCFAIATLLTWYYPWLGVVFYLIAGLVGYSRIYVGVHYPSDVIAGACIGVLIAAAVIRIVYNRIEPLKPQYRVRTKRRGLRSVAKS